MAHHDEIAPLLSRAALGGETEQRSFFVAILRAQLFVPLRRPGELEMLVAVDQEGRTVLPVFSSPEFVREWAEIELPYRQLSFSSLLGAIDPQLWVHINPGQEFGKELSPWELVQLGQGEGAIDGILHDLSENAPDDAQYQDGTEQFGELIPRLRPILEAYEEIENASLLAVRHQQSGEWLPMVGLTYTSRSQERLAILRNEIESLGAIIVVDDLADPSSPNQILFNGISPFYVR